MRDKKNAYMILVGKQNEKLILGEYIERGRHGLDLSGS
jgi:hypothetical protein